MAFECGPRRGAWRGRGGGGPAGRPRRPGARRALHRVPDAAAAGRGRLLPAVRRGGRARQPHHHHRAQQVQEGAQRYGRLHHEPRPVRPAVRAAHAAARRLHLLAPVLGARLAAVPALPAAALRPARRVAVQRAGHHHQQIRHDRPPHAVPQAVPRAVPGPDGGLHLGVRLRRAGGDLAGQVGALRAGPAHRLVLHPARRSRPHAQGVPLHHGLRHPLHRHRRLLRAHLLHRPPDGAQVAAQLGGRGAAVAAVQPARVAAPGEQLHDDGAVHVHGGVVLGVRAIHGALLAPVGVLHAAVRAQRGAAAAHAAAAAAPVRAHLPGRRLPLRELHERVAAVHAAAVPAALAVRLAQDHALRWQQAPVLRHGGRHAALQPARQDDGQGPQAAQDDPRHLRRLRHLLPAHHRLQGVPRLYRRRPAQHRGLRMHLPDHLHQPHHLRGDELRVPAGLQEPAHVPVRGHAERRAERGARRQVLGEVLPRQHPAARQEAAGPHVTGTPAPPRTPGPAGHDRARAA